MQTKLHKWRLLSGEERWLHLEAWWYLGVARIGLWLIGFRRFIDILNRMTHFALEVGDFDLNEAFEIGFTVRRMAWYQVFDANCLHRSLATWWLLRQHGLPGEIRIGVKWTEDGKIDAHAWVEHETIVLNDSPDVGERFSTFETPILGISYIN